MRLSLVSEKTFDELPQMNHLKKGSKECKFEMLNERNNDVAGVVVSTWARNPEIRGMFDGRHYWRMQDRVKNGFGSRDVAPSGVMNAHFGPRLSARPRGTSRSGPGMASQCDHD